MYSARYSYRSICRRHAVVRLALALTATISLLGSLFPSLVTAAPAIRLSIPVDSPDPSTSQIQVTGPHRADGQDQATITITLRDAQGQPVAGKRVVVTSSGAQNTLTEPSSPTDANGGVVATLTSTQPGAKAIRVGVVDADGTHYLPQTPLIEFTGASISGLVFLDDDKDGAYDADERAISGVPVMLYASGETTPLAQQATTADGYRFSGLLAGLYRVAAATLEGYAASGPQETTLQLEAFGSSADHAFGRRSVASIQGRVWSDGDQDGQQDANEAGIANALVTVAGPTGAMQSAASGADGQYQITVDAARSAAPENFTFVSDGYPVQEPLSARVDNADFSRGAVTLDSALFPENYDFSAPGISFGEADLPANYTFNTPAYNLDPSTYPENYSFSAPGQALPSSALFTNTDFEAGALGPWEGQDFTVDQSSHDGSWAAYRPAGYLGSITSPAFTIPAAAQSLKWWWKSNGDNRTFFELLNAEGTAVLTPMFSDTGTGDGWIQSSYNVTPYAGQQVRFRMRNTYSGHYVYLDDLQLTVDVPGWTIEEQPGLTQRFYITGESHDGASQALYRPTGTTQSITSPAFTIPAAAQSLKWWWKTNAGNCTYFELLNAESGALLATMFSDTGTGGAWIQSSYNIAAYAGQPVRFRMRNTYSGHYVYLDDLQLTVDVPGWTIEGQPGLTQRFYITGESHDGASQALYRPTGTTQSITSPAFTIPATAQSLKWWWKTNAGNRTFFELLNAESGVLLATMFSDTGTNNGWIQSSYNIAAYAGQQVRFRMRNTYSGHYVYLDDLQLTVDVPGWTIEEQPGLTQRVSIVSESHSGTSQALYRPTGTTQSITSPAFTIPATAQSLKWWWKSNGDNRTFFELLNAEGTAVLTPMFSDTGTGDGWIQSSYNVTPYAGQQVRFRMRNTYSGHYVYLDDLQLTVDVPGWTIEEQPGLTQRFYITGESHDGASQALYRPTGTTQSITSPAFTIPAAAQSLKWWWKTNAGNCTYFELLNAESGALLATMFSDTGTGGAWIQSSYNIAAYAGQPVRFRMRNTYSGHYVYLDDLQLTVDVPGWTIEGQPGLTQRFYITGESHDGASQALYRPTGTTQSITSPAFTIPATAQSLKWWWKTNAGNRTFFELLNAESGVLLATMFSDTGTNNGWIQSSYNIAAYAGQQVRFRMRNTYSSHYVYLDDILLEPASTTPYTVTAYHPANYAATTPDHSSVDLAGGQVATINFGAYPTALYQAYVAVSPQSVAADGASTALVSAVLRDASGAPLPNRAVDLIATGQGLTLTQSAPQTNASGIVTGTLTTAYPQTAYVTARSQSDNVILSDPVSVTFVAEARPNLAVTLRGATEIPQGSTEEYRITVRNNGGATARDMVITQQLPAGVSFVSHTAPVAVEQSGSTAIWRVSELPPTGEIRFAVSAFVPATLPVQQSLVSTVQITSSTLDEDASDNSATSTVTIVPAYAFAATLSTPALTVYPGMVVTPTLQLANRGWLGDSYTLTTSGDAAAWLSLPTTTVGLGPGATTTLPLVISPPAACQQNATPSAQIIVQSAGLPAAQQTLTTTLTLAQAPAITIDAPLPTTTSGSRSVVFTWRTSAVSTGTLTLTPDGQPDQAQTFSTPAGTTHAVPVTNLLRGTSYTWQVTAAGSCGTATSPAQHLTIGNGIVFSQHQQAYTVQRDYNQLVAIEVQNQDLISHTLTMRIDHPYEDLIVNFVGSGSVDESITLLPGERRSVQLAIHAQDATQRAYTLVGRLTSDEGAGTPITDSSLIEVAVLAAGDFTLHEVGVDAQTGARTYEVTNHGLPITDLDVDAVRSSDGQPARVYLTPDVHHARLGTGETITIKAIPLFGPDDVAASPPAGGVNIPANLAYPAQVYSESVNLRGSGGGETKTLPTEAGCAPGTQPYAVHRQNVIMRFPTSSWYCTNRPNIELPVNLPAFVSPSAVSRMGLRMGFSPQSDVRPHTTNVSFNGAAVGSASGIPNGSYEWPIDPALLNQGPAVGTVQQQIALTSNHPNGGHYVVSTGVELGVALDDVTVYVCAHSQAEAEQIADELYGFVPQPTALAVSIQSPLESQEIDLADTPTVPLQVLVADDLPTYANIYRVIAQLTYLDDPQRPPETVTLSDDNDDRRFVGGWTPQAPGNVHMQVTAQSVDGLEDTAETTFYIRALPDLVAFSVGLNWTRIEGWRKAIPYIDIVNDGATITQDVQVLFRYYPTDAHGEPVFDEDKLIDANVVTISSPLWWDPWDNNETKQARDEGFKPEENGLYYVQIIVDPPPELIPPK